MFEKTWLWIPQPNSGRIGRSPGAVPRMMSIASCTSASPEREREAAEPVDPQRERDAGADDVRHRSHPRLIWVPEIEIMPVALS